MKSRGVEGGNYRRRCRFNDRFHGLPLRNSSGPRRNVPRVVGKFVEWRLRNVPFWTRRPLFHSACFRATKFTGMAYLEFAAIEINVSYNTRASPLSNDIVHDTVVSLRDIRGRVDAYSFWMNSLHDGRWQAWFSGIFERLNVKVFFLKKTFELWIVF